MASNKYDAFTGLMNAVLYCVDLMDATAQRSSRGELSPAEYQNRLTDLGAILRDRVKIANEVYFKPDA